MDRFLVKLNKDGTTLAPSSNASTSKIDKIVDEENNNHLKTVNYSCTSNDNDDSDKLTDVSDKENESTDANSDSNSEQSEPANAKKKRKIYKQKFRTTWLERYPWIQNKKGEAFCKVCRKTIIGGAYHLDRHETRTRHVRKMKSAQSTPGIITAIKNSPQLKTHYLIKEAEMKLVWFFCQYNLAFLLMDNLPPLLAHIFPDSAVARGLKIKRKKATQLVTNNLAPYAKNQIIEILRREKFSMIIDETTDVSTIKSLVVVVRYYDNVQNSVKDRFFDLVAVESATAQGLFSSIKSLLDKSNIPYENLIGFGADNASVMMGEFNGVQRRLKDLSPNIIVRGCSCHSLHICASKACLKLPNTVEQFCRDIYSYFSNSSKRTEELRECQVFAEEKPSQMLYPSQTRWLSVRMVCQRILDHWNSLTLFFQRAALEDNLQSAQIILSALKNPIYKLYLQFLSYVLELVTKLNAELQSESPKLPALLENVTRLYKIILKCFIKNDVINKNEIIQISVENRHNYKEIESIFFGGLVDLTLTNPDELSKIDKSDLHNFRIRCLDFYIELCLQIKQRFNFADPILKYVSKFLPRNVVSGNIMSISEFSRFFPTLQLDVNEVNMEYQLISEHFVKEQYESFDSMEFWSAVNKTKNGLDQPMFPNVMILLKYILALPHSSAAAERIFSQLFLIKTKLRNKLKIETCSAILSVKDLLSQKSFDIYSWHPSQELLSVSEKNLHDNTGIIYEDEDIL